MPKRFINLDGQESIYFARQLEYVKTKTYDQPFPEMKALTGLLPVSMEAGPAADSITYRSFTEHGIAKFLTNYADDLPRVDVSGIEESVKVRSIGDSFGYTVQDVRYAAKAGIPLQASKAIAARRAIEMLINKSAWKARAADTTYHGLIGLLYNPNVTSYKVAVEGSDYVWADKSADAIIADINTLANTPIKLSKGYEIPDTFLCPITQFTLISTTPRSSYSDTTILDFVKKSNPHITRWDWLEELKDVNPVPSTGAAANTDCALVYKNSSDKLTLEVPQGFEQFPPQEKGLEFIVPCHARFASVIIYYPISVVIAENI